MCISSTSIKIIDYLFLHLYLRVIPIMQVIHLSYMYNNCLLNDFIIYYIHAYIYWNLWWYLILKFSKHDIISVNFCILLHVISPGYYDIINMYRDRYFRTQAVYDEYYRALLDCSDYSYMYTILTFTKMYTMLARRLT